jgi:hypothetical protein
MKHAGGCRRVPGYQKSVTEGGSSGKGWNEGLQGHDGLKYPLMAYGGLRLLEARLKGLKIRFPIVRTYVIYS